MSTLQMERRAFLKISVAASGGLLIGLYLPGASKLAAAQERSASAFMPNAFLRIGTDERVTVIVNHSEMGQGVYTALPMLLAEELDADWSKIGYESAPVDAKYNHPIFGMQITGGSSSVYSGFEQYRGRGALECRSGKSAYGIRNGTRWHESQVKLRSARRSSGKDDTARKGHSKGCQGVQADRHAGKAARYSRKNKWQSRFWHRRQKCWNAYRGGCPRSCVRRKGEELR